jgi:hypothetical protein
LGLGAIDVLLSEQTSANATFSLLRYGVYVPGNFYIFIPTKWSLFPLTLRSLDFLFVLFWVIAIIDELVMAGDTNWDF